MRKDLVAVLALASSSALAMAACIGDGSNGRGSTDVHTGPPVDGGNPLVPTADATVPPPNGGPGGPDASDDGASASDAGADVVLPLATGDLLWARSYLSSGSGAAVQVAVDPSGNHYLIGEMSGGGADFGGDAGVLGGSFMAKVDPSGATVWGVALSAQHGYGIARDPSTGALFAVLGITSAVTVAGTTFTPQGLALVIAKVDPATGAFVQAKMFAGTNAASVQTLQFAAGGGHLLAAGWFYGGSPDLGGGTLTLVGAQDAWVLDVDEATMTHVFSKAYGGVSTNGSAAWGAALDSTGNAYVGGYLYGQTNLGGGTVDAGDVTATPFLVALGPTGALRWAKLLGTGGIVRDLALDSHDNVYATGSFVTASDFGAGVVAGPSAYIASWTPAGALRFVTPFGGGQTYTSGVAVDAFGESAATGWFSSSFALGDGGFTANSEENGYLLKVDPAGALLWAKQWKGQVNGSTSGIDIQPHDIDVDPSGAFGVVGDNFGGQMIIDPSTTLDGSASSGPPFFLKTKP